MSPAGTAAHDARQRERCREVASGILEGCGFHVLRGGSSRRASRRRPLALLALLRHARRHPRTLCGVAVDGSHGPRRALKSGGLALARATRSDVLVSSPGNPMPHVQSGRMRALAVSANARLPAAYASTPTWKELGINSVSRFWRGVIGPKGLSPEQVAYWEAEFTWLVSTDEWKKYLADNLLIPDFMNARDATRFLQSEAAEYRTLLTELGLAK